MWWSTPYWLLLLILPFILLPSVFQRFRGKTAKPAGIRNVASELENYFRTEQTDDLAPGLRRRLKVLLGLRLAALICVILALAGTEMLLPSRSRQMVVALDCSASIGPVEAEKARGAALEALKQLGPEDRAAALIFAGETRVVSPLSTPGETMALVESIRLEVPRDQESNLQAAVETGTEILRDVWGNRLFLFFSDGRPTTGGIPEETGTGIPVYTIPIGRQETEIKTGELELPESAHAGETVLAGWKVFSGEERLVRMILRVDGLVVEREERRIPVGTSVIPFSLAAGEPGWRRVETELFDMDGASLPGATAGGILPVTGPAQVLVVRSNTNAALMQALQIQGMKVTTGGVGALPETSGGLVQYAAVVLDNIPAYGLSKAQQQALKQYVAGGGGLLVVGGENSLGRGEYYDTELEELLPVRTDTRKRLYFTKANILFIVDVSGSMSDSAGKITKQMAVMQGVAAAINELNPQDEVGILTFNVKTDWLLPFTPARRKEEIREVFSKMGSGGGTDMAPALEQAYQAFTQIGPVRRHVVIMSDGLTDDADFAKLTQQLQSLDITVTTVGVGQPINESLLKDMAKWGNGEFYWAELGEIPQILRKETVRVTRDLIQEGTFTPNLVSPGDFLQGLENAPPIRGYLITKPKELATVHLEAPSPSGEENDPLLAVWRYGNGKTAVFTGDSGQRWVNGWPGSYYNRFFSQTVRSLMRTGRNEGLMVSVRAAGGEARIAVDATGADRRLRTGLQLTGRPLDTNGPPFKFRETAPGHYEAALPLDTPGLRQFKVEEDLTGDWSIGWVWNPAGDEGSGLGPDTVLLTNMSSGSGGRMIGIEELRQDPARVLPPARWTWTKRSIRIPLVILALFLFLVELGLRSTALGQFTAFRNTISSWWAKQMQAVDKLLNPQGPTGEREFTNREISASYRYLAGKKRNRE